MQGGKDNWLSIKIIIKTIVSGDITNMGIFRRDDVGVGILLQFGVQSSAFGVEVRTQRLSQISSDSMENV